MTATKSKAKGRGKAKQTVVDEHAIKVRLNRLRALARRRGFSLEKSRRRDPHAQDFGMYGLYSLDGTKRESHDDFNLDALLTTTSLDKVEEYLLTHMMPLREQWSTADLEAYYVKSSDPRWKNWPWDFVREVPQYLSRIPSEVPAGRVLVHNHVTPTQRLGSRGFRAWLQKPDAKRLEVCRCGWAPGLKHYRVEVGDDDAVHDALVLPRGQQYEQFTGSDDE